MFLFLSILHNPVSCRADGLLGDAHDAAHGILETTSWNKRLLRRRAVVHVLFVEDEEERIVGALLIILKSRCARWNFLEHSEKHLPPGARPSPYWRGLPVLMKRATKVFYFAISPALP